ncbi:MAG: hypothetical protein M1825_006127 [Sarcosagium campestre]|nr:MAG: hypothetical protein M1825_006127 [Sarcosagium campestre]
MEGSARLFRFDSRQAEDIDWGVGSGADEDQASTDVQFETISQLIDKSTASAATGPSARERPELPLLSLDSQKLVCRTISGYANVTYDRFAGVGSSQFDLDDPATLDQEMRRAITQLEAVMDAQGVFDEQRVEATPADLRDLTGLTHAPI